jgi:hypothetical protein
VKYGVPAKWSDIRAICWGFGFSRGKYSHADLECTSAEQCKAAPTAASGATQKKVAPRT